MNQTLPGRPIASPQLIFALPLTLMLSVGTGGHLNESVYISRLAGTGTPFAHLREIKSIVTATTADDLARIRTILKMSVQQLANCLGVSRQAIYDWKAGGNIKQANLSKLENLKIAAAIIEGSGITVTPLMMARKLSGGKNLLDTIAAGGDGTATAHSLIGVLRQEAEQKDRLAKRFAGRDKTSGPASDYGYPLLSERD